MIRRFVFALVLGCALTIGASAEVVVRIGPPRPLVERRPPPPGREYVWTPGYHRWDGERHVWVGGAWVMPPRPRAHWVPARWEHRRDGWIFVEGHWR